MSSDNQGNQFEHWKRNFMLMTLDGAVFMTAISLLDVSVFSVFIVEATGSTFLAGVLQMLRSAGFFIPQILSVDVGSKPLKKMIIFKWTLLARCSLIIAVLTTFLVNDLQMIVFSVVVSLSLFPAFDGFTMIPWLELITKSFPTTKRGSYFGLMQFTGGLGMVLSGFIVSLILSTPNLPFPSNYGMLLLIAVIILLGSLTFIILLKETPDEVTGDKQSLLQSLQSIPQLIKEDEAVKKLAIIQILISFYSMATPFYSLYALSRLGADESLVGLFLSFQMLGRLTSSFIWGYLANRGLNKHIIQCTGLMLLASPIIAVVIGTSLIPREFVESMILLIFFLIGSSMGGVWLGFNNYVMDVSDRKRRPILLGFINSLNAVTSVLPLIGGVIIEYLSYEIIFIGSAVPVGLALILTRYLKQKIRV